MPNCFANLEAYDRRLPGHAQWCADAGSTTQHQTKVVEVSARGNCRNRPLTSRIFSTANFRLCRPLSLSLRLNCTAEHCSAVGVIAFDNGHACQSHVLLDRTFLPAGSPNLSILTTVTRALLDIFDAISFGNMVRVVLVRRSPFENKLLVTGYYCQRLLSLSQHDYCSSRECVSA
jgi:hypothetical protein